MTKRRAGAQTRSRLSARARFPVRPGSRWSRRRPSGWGRPSAARSCPATATPTSRATIRGYRHDLNHRVLPDLRRDPASDVRRGDFQALVDRLHGPGLVRLEDPERAPRLRGSSPGRDRARRSERQPDLRAPAPERSQAARPGRVGDEAAALLAALPDADRALWATAFYAGLRRGELRGLRWDDVDLAAGIIHVRRGWDDTTGEVAPKSAKGTRTVPITALLRDDLARLKASTGRGGDDRLRDQALRTRSRRRTSASGPRRRGRRRTRSARRRSCRRSSRSASTSAGTPSGSLLHDAGLRSSASVTTSGTRRAT